MRVACSPSRGPSNANPRPPSRLFWCVHNENLTKPSQVVPHSDEGSAAPTNPAAVATTSLDGATLIALVQDAVREFARHGVKRLVLVLGHYENTWFVTEGIQLALRELGPACDLEVMRLEHWDFCKEETLDDIFPDGFPGFALEHAAVIETSLMLHYLPHLVSLDKIPNDPPADFPPYDMYPTRTEWVPPSGVLSSALGSTAEKGARMADDIVTGIAAAVRHEFKLEA